MVMKEGSYFVVGYTFVVNVTSIGWFWPDAYRHEPSLPKLSDRRVLIAPKELVEWG